MYHRDHGPPHFHAEYGEFEAQLEIASLSVLRGRLPARALGLVLEWAAQHRDELHDNWDRAERHDVLRPVAPLE